jgi:aryl-alcohol dehydrogenase-like predicted oxidoreductase
MKRRILGRTGLAVSELSLGTVEIGMDYGIPVEGSHGRPEEAEAARLLNHALDMGINFLDTARLYGEAEAIIGRALSTRRPEYVLASKAPSFHQEDLTSAQRKQKIAESVKESLRQLQTDVIDILMIHSAPQEVILQGDALEALRALREEGHIRFLGASVYGEEAALAAIADGGYDCLQIAYSALDRRPERAVLPEAARHQVGIVARSVVLKGVLTYKRRGLPPALRPLIEAADRLEALAGGEVASLPELAYRYALAQSPPHSLLVGTGSLEELEAAAGFVRKGPLSPELISRIREMPAVEESLLNPGTWPALR